MTGSGGRCSMACAVLGVLLSGCAGSSSVAPMPRVQSPIPANVRPVAAVAGSTVLARIIAELDRDDDGALSMAEVERAGTGPGMVALLDRDGDAALSPEERLAAGERLLQLDGDGDGRVNASELAAAGRPAMNGVVAFSF